MPPSSNPQSQGQVEAAAAYLDGLGKESVMEAEGGGGLDPHSVEAKQLAGKAEGYFDAAEYLRTEFSARTCPVDAVLARARRIRSEAEKELAADEVDSWEAGNLLGVVDGIDMLLGDRPDA